MDAADPRRADMREIINTKIKFREKFRPFAPSILEEAMSDYFVGAAVDPFMQQVYPVRPEKRGILPAVTHVDGSGRLREGLATLFAAPDGHLEAPFESRIIVGHHR